MKLCFGQGASFTINRYKQNDAAAIQELQPA